MDIRSISPFTPSSGQLVADKSSAADVGTATAPPPAAPLVTATAVTQSDKVPSAEQVTQAVAQINKKLQGLSQNLEFSVDKDSHKVIVKIVDLQTKAVIRQIPTEEALEISKSLDKLQGLLIKQQA